MSNGVDKDHDRHSVDPDLGPVCRGYQQTTKIAVSMKTAYCIPLLSNSQLKKAQS